MFLYFVQRKGFLDGDRDYLRNRLRKLRAEHGSDQFYSFYRYFLLRLFHEGLGAKVRQSDLEKLVGRVPYLNGGIFDVHKLERSKAEGGYGDDIQILDTAFEAVFNFFDRFQWHLDERPLRKDDEINPDVLGYIFEKYINQKQMGAYYTKEDITGYIGQNTILPFLFDAVRGKVKAAFEGEKSVWSHLQSDPDRYIYPAVRHGLSWDYQPNHLESGEPLVAERPLPTEIAAGLDTTQPDLLVRRKSWNKPAPATFGLPKETWRETIARRQRCADMRVKLAAGEVQSIADLITLNLDLRRFAQDVIARCDSAELLAAFWHTLAGKTPDAKSTKKLHPALTILDPTCGSGAFLFAALNLLEPLYEACLDRMEGLLADARIAGTKIHPESHLAEFADILQQIERHPNERYFIFKTIILRNLYGVDLMEEAVEICKLRLFLKLAAQVEPDPDDANLGIEPLPDIDFNIRSGNTLVGYATRAELEAVAEKDLLLKEEVKVVLEAAENAAAAFETFVQSQVDGENPAKFKRDLSQRLEIAREQCDRFLAESYRMGITKKQEEFLDWKRTHQPFHWFIEFFGILNAGGFHVIIGNPPYAEIPKNLSRKLLRSLFATALEKWSRDEDLYTLIVERSLKLTRADDGKFGMILPLSLAFSTKKPFGSLRKELMKEDGFWWWSHYDRIPSSLFGNEVRTRCTIAILHRTGIRPGFTGATTALMRWNTEYRNCLLATIHYCRLSLDITAGIPKLSSQIQADVLTKLINKKAFLGPDLGHPVSFSELANAAPNFPQKCIFIGGTAYNWFPAWRDIPQTTDMNGKPSLPARTAGYQFSSEEEANIVFGLLCSSLGYWWWATASDAFNLKKWLLERFPVSIALIPKDKRSELAKLGADLRTELRKNYVFKDNKGRIGNFFLPACESSTFRIDQFLAVNVPPLNAGFMEDIKNFNSVFSRAEILSDESESAGDLEE